MTKRVRGVRAFGTALALVSVLAGCSRRTTDAPLAVGQPAPTYVVTSLEGGVVSIAGLRGKVVLLNAWATWCVPCRAEIPEIRALHTVYAGQGLEVVGVSLDDADAAPAIQDFITQHNMRYQIWRDPAQKFSTDFRFEGLPMTVLIDKAGVLRWIWKGKLEATDTTLDAAIRKALVMSPSP